MKKWVIVLIVILLALGFIYDKTITKSIVEYRIPALNNFVVLIGGGIIYVLVFLISTGLFLWKRDKRKYVPVLWLSMILAYVFAFIIKNIIMRARPELAPLITPITQFSFPSGHAAVVFSVLAILEKGFKKISKIWFILALLVCFSRVYLGVHYVSDVLGGALLGYFISMIALELEDNYNFSRKILKIFGIKDKKIKIKKKKKR